MPRKKLSKRERKRRARRSAHNHHLRSSYGITYEEYETLLAAQEGVCAICGGGTSKRHFAVDHNHRTGQVRGLLCARCNTGLARFMDSQENVERALGHLRSGGRWVNKILGRKVIVPNDTD